MSLKGRIEKLETHHASGKNAVTLGELVEASYWDEDDPRHAELNERCSRSRLAESIAKSSKRDSPDPGRQDESR